MLKFVFACKKDIEIFVFLLWFLLGRAVFQIYVVISIHYRQFLGKSGDKHFDDSCNAKRYIRTENYLPVGAHVLGLIYLNEHLLCHLQSYTVS